MNMQINTLSMENKKKKYTFKCLLKKLTFNKTSCYTMAVTFNVYEYIW